MFRLAGIFAFAAAGAAAASLSNGSLKAEFNGRGLTAITDRNARFTWRLPKDEFAITIGGRVFDSASLPAPEVQTGEGLVNFIYPSAPYNLQVRYELRPGWHFVSKQIVIADGPVGKVSIDRVTVFRSSVANSISDAAVLNRAREDLGTRDWGAFLRSGKSHGLLVTAQNPFLNVQRQGGDFTVSYTPALEYDLQWGHFEADCGVLAPYEATGRRQAEKMLPEWSLGPIDESPGLDEAEVAAFTGAVRGFLLYKPTNPLNIMVGWCENDYQIDIATVEGRREYKRILDMAASLGAEHVLFAPANSALARRENSRDDWKWEYILWLGLGQKIRNNDWDVDTGEIPAPVREMLSYAESKRLKLVAYVYPVMGFLQSRKWLVENGTRANLGSHDFQDWLIQALETFLRRTGISGYSFDHTFLTYPGASKYAQWWGWRRVMERLRLDIPDIVIDGRQAYQNYGPWTWLAGSYPHPTSTDEQPESFVSFPDLKLDRVSADRERYTAYRYRNYDFAPSEIVPGFITHQTARSDDSGEMPEATPGGELLPFRRRDWDYLGWRYSLLSSIAVAGWNNVIDMIPARDPAEFEHFSQADRDWFRHWIDFADANKEFLRHARPILGQPALGKVDGTAAIDGDAGYLFLFNPNGRRLEAKFQLDETIGLKARGKYSIHELYPVDERLIAKPETGPWSFEDEFVREMDGGSALVLFIKPYEPGGEPRVYNVPGTAAVAGGVLRLEGVKGEAGTSETILVGLPSSAKVTSAEIGGISFPMHTVKAGLIEIPVSFAGAPFRHYQQIDRYDPGFTGGTVRGSFRVPRRVFEQLAARRLAWPIPWTGEDYRSTWLVPERLLLFVQIAEPDDRWTASLKIDAQAVELKKAYASVRPNRRNFTGFYADVSKLEPDREHTLELELPATLKPGQYQGVFFENVETEYTAPQPVKQ